VDRPTRFGVAGTAVIDGFTQKVEHPAKGFLADRDGDGRAGIDGIDAAPQAIGGAQRHRADAAAAQVLLDFAGQIDDQAILLRVDFKGVVDGRKLILGELGVESRADDLRDLSGRGH